jgi:Leucine-rich repeat (LRR) protein
MQGIAKLEGLQGCPSLERVWVIENKLACIEGLAHLTDLQELYLYSNCITKIEGLSSLTGLQVSSNSSVGHNV